MPIGSQVYHIDLKLNLIVCQINAKGQFVCINPQISNDGIFQTIITSKSKLIKGWKSIYD